MTQIVNMHEAKTHFSRIGAKVASGEEVIIAKAGKPYFRCVPLKQTLVDRSGLIGAFGGKIARTDDAYDDLPPDTWDVHNDDT